jgi:hypothetical protein
VKFACALVEPQPQPLDCRRFCTGRLPGGAIMRLWEEKATLFVHVPVLPTVSLSLSTCAA